MRLKMMWGSGADSAFPYGLRKALWKWLKKATPSPDFFDGESLALYILEDSMKIYENANGSEEMGSIAGKVCYLVRAVSNWM